MGAIVKKLGVLKTDQWTRSALSIVVSHQLDLRRTAMTILFSLLFIGSVWAHDNSITVIETKPQLQSRFEELANTFTAQGTSAVAEAIQNDVSDPQKLEQWRTFAAGGEVTVIDVKVHPNEAAALEWMNQRFERMGLPNLSFKGIHEAGSADPTAIDDAQIKGKKWLRYSAGPGVAMVAFLMNLSGTASGHETLYLIIPAVSAGVTTVALEVQFAWPWLNNVFWKKVWTRGGVVGGRLINVFVNFLYGMSIYGSTRGGEWLAHALGSGQIHSPVTFTQAVVSAAIGAVTFHMAMGQYQTDIATEEARGSISAAQRYGMETNGVLVNNSARVVSWVLPGGSIYGSLAQGGFFLWKTFPQLLKTNFLDSSDDRRVAAAVKGEEPQSSFLDGCARLLRRSPLHPALRK